MNATTGSLVRQAVLVAAGIGVYHFALAPKGSGDRASRLDAPTARTDETIAALRREIDALKQRGPAEPTPGGTDAAGALASRLEALERRIIPTSADSGARDLGHLPAGIGEPATTWTEEQIASFRALLEEVEQRKTTDRETASYRDLVRRVDPNLAPAEESATVSLLTNFMRTIRGIFVGGSAGNSAEERVAANQKAAAARTKLLADLRAILRKEDVDGLAQHLPEFSTPAGLNPPTAPDAAMAGSR